MDALGDSEDQVQVLERAALGFLDEREDEEEGGEIEARKGAECAGGLFPMKKAVVGAWYVLVRRSKGGKGRKDADGGNVSDRMPANRRLTAIEKAQPCGRSQ